jgi:hypothetical protein
MLLLERRRAERRIVERRRLRRRRRERPQAKERRRLERRDRRRRHTGQLVRQASRRPEGVTIEFLFPIAAVLGILIGMVRAYLTGDPVWLLVSAGGLLTGTIFVVFAICSQPKRGRRSERNG